MPEVQEGNENADKDKLLEVRKLKLKQAIDAIRFIYGPVTNITEQKFSVTNDPYSDLIIRVAFGGCLIKLVCGINIGDVPYYEQISQEGSKEGLRPITEVSSIGQQYEKLIRGVKGEIDKLLQPTADIMPEVQEGNENADKDKLLEVRKLKLKQAIDAIRFIYGPVTNITEQKFSVTNDPYSDLIIRVAFGGCLIKLVCGINIGDVPVFEQLNPKSNDEPKPINEVSMVGPRYEKLIQNVQTQIDELSQPTSEPVI